MFMLMADYHYRLQTGTTPKDARGMLRDGLQATLGSTFRVGAGLSFIENVLEKGSLEGSLSSKFLEGAARQPELIPMLRTQFFIMMGLVDAVPMIGVGIGFYILFAL